MEERIEPSTYDVIVLGTGLPESVLAASIAACGKSVLHLDCTGFYGAHWTSLSFPQISSFASSSNGHLPCPEYFPHHQILNPRIPSTPDDSVDSNGNSGFQQVHGLAQQQQHPDDGSVADPGSFSPPNRSFGNGAVADGALEGLVEDELEVLEMGEQPSLYSSLRVWSSEGASLGPTNRFYLDLAGQ